MTPEQYALILPYINEISIEQCKPALCDKLASIHESLGYGHVNRTCSGCITDMLKRLNAFRLDYESKL